MPCTRSKHLSRDFDDASSTASTEREGAFATPEPSGRGSGLADRPPSPPEHLVSEVLEENSKTLEDNRRLTEENRRLNET